MTQSLRFIPFACGWGAKRRECADGPRFLQDWQLTDKLSRLGIEAAWDDSYYSPLEEGADPSLPVVKALPLVADYNRALAARVQDTLHGGAFPVTIGGDHSMGVGTWSAVTQTLDCAGRFGLIWFDAHLDAHTPQTTPSGAYHGMPLASLLGHGERELREIAGRQVKLSPQHVCLVGARDYEPEEHDLLKRLGVRIFYMKDIRARGMDAVMQEALAIATAEDTAGFGLSIDLDGFDPSAAPGVGSPAAGGIGREEGLRALLGLGLHPQLKALEIAEYNPSLDQGDRTARLILEILAMMWSAEG